MARGICLEISGGCLGHWPLIRRDTHVVSSKVREGLGEGRGTSVLPTRAPSPGHPQLLILSRPSQRHTGRAALTGWRPCCAGAAYRQHSPGSSSEQTGGFPFHRRESSMGMIHRMTDGENGYTGKPGREAWGGGGRVPI